MMNDTAEADDVGDWLQKKYPAEFGGDKLLVIHTNRSGEVSKKDLEEARARGPRRGQRQQPGQLHRQRRDAPRGLGRAGRDGDRRPAPLHRQGQHPARADGRPRPAADVPRRGQRLRRARGRDRQQEVHRVRRAAGKEEDLQLDTFEIGKDKVSIVTIEPDAGQARQGHCPAAAQPDPGSARSRWRTRSPPWTCRASTARRCRARKTTRPRAGVPLRGLRPDHASRS